MSESILLAVTGMSPAVITETLWALAREPELVVPTKVVVVTTLVGKSRIETSLLAPSPRFGGISPWEALRRDISALGMDLSGKLQFGPTGDNIRVISAADSSTFLTRELPDLRSPEENEAAADFLLETVRGIVENPDLQLVASLAGGRKTMGALLYACLTLIGRDDDRLTHVLVNDPFDSVRDFWFPAQPGGSLSLSDGSPLDPSTAEVLLAEVPFVPLRNLFQRDLGQPAGSFRRLVETCSSNVRRTAGENLRLEISSHRTEAVVNGRRIELSPREHLVLLFLAQRAKSAKTILSAYDEAIVELEEFRTALRAAAPPDNWSDWRHADSLARSFDTRELTRVVSDLRAKSKRAGGDCALLAAVLPAKGRCSLDIPAPLIHIVGDCLA